MNDLKDLVPKDSLDSSHIHELEKLTDEEITQITPELFSLIVHTDWPITEHVLTVLSFHQKALVPFIKNDLEEEADSKLKYVIIATLLPFFEIDSLEPLLPSLSRIIKKPSLLEHAFENDYAASMLLAEDGIKI
ncbi:MAG: DUF5071 domain-containing protein [Bacilli bacterium]